MGDRRADPPDAGQRRPPRPRPASAHQLAGAKSFEGPRRPLGSRRPRSAAARISGAKATRTETRIVQEYVTGDRASARRLGALRKVLKVADRARRRASKVPPKSVPHMPYVNVFATRPKSEAESSGTTGKAAKTSVGKAKKRPKSASAVRPAPPKKRGPARRRPASATARSRVVTMKRAGVALGNLDADSSSPMKMEDMRAELELARQRMDRVASGSTTASAEEGGSREFRSSVREDFESYKQDSGRRDAGDKQVPCRGKVILHVHRGTDLAFRDDRKLARGVDLAVEAAFVFDMPPLQLKQALDAGRQLIMLQRDTQKDISVPFFLTEGAGLGLSEIGAESVSSGDRMLSPSMAAALQSAVQQALLSPRAAEEKAVNVPTVPSLLEHFNVLVNMNRQVRRSRVHHSSPNPVWEDRLGFEVSHLNLSCGIHVRVVNVSHTEEEATVCEGFLPAGRILLNEQSKTRDIRLTMYREGRTGMRVPTGQVVLSVEFKRAQDDPDVDQGNLILKCAGVGPHDPLFSISDDLRKQLGAASRERLGTDLMSHLPLLRPLFHHVMACFGDTSTLRITVTDEGSAGGEEGDATHSARSAAQRSGLTRQEFVAIVSRISLVPAAHLNELFLKMDADGDGTLTFNEYVSFLIKQADNSLAHRSAQGSYLVDTSRDNGSQLRRPLAEIKKLLTLPSHKAYLSCTSNQEITLWDASNLSQVLLFDTDAVVSPVKTSLPFTTVPGGGTTWSRSGRWASKDGVSARHIAGVSRAWSVSESAAAISKSHGVDPQGMHTRGSADDAVASNVASDSTEKEMFHSRVRDFVYDETLGRAIVAYEHRIVKVFDIGRYSLSGALPLQQVAQKRRSALARWTVVRDQDDRVAKACRMLDTSKDSYNSSEVGRPSKPAGRISAAHAFPVVVPYTAYGTGPGAPLCVTTALGNEGGDGGRMGSGVYAVGDTKGYVSVNSAESLARIASVAVGSDGLLSILAAPRLGLVSGCMDGKIYSTDLNSLCATRTFEQHENGVTRLGWSKSERFLVSAGFDKRCLIWDPFAKNSVASLNLHASHAVIQSIEINDAHNQIAVATSDCQVRIFDVRTFQQIQAFSDDSQRHLLGATYDHDRLGLLSFGTQLNLLPIRAVVGNEVTASDAQFAHSTHMALFSKARPAEVGSTSPKAAATKKPTRVRRRNTMKAQMLRRHLKGTTSLVASMSTTTDVEPVLDAADPQSLVSVSLSRLFDLVVAVRAGGEVSVWEVSSGKVSTSFTAFASHSDSSSLVMQHIASDDLVVTAACLDARERRLVVATSDGAVCLWNFTNGDLLRQLPRLSAEVSSIAYQPDDGVPLSIVGGAWGGRVAMWADAPDDDDLMGGAEDDAPSRYARTVPTRDAVPPGRAGRWTSVPPPRPTTDRLNDRPAGLVAAAAETAGAAIVVASKWPQATPSEDEHVDGILDDDDSSVSRFDEHNAPMIDEHAGGGSDGVAAVRWCPAVADIQAKQYASHASAAGKTTFVGGSAGDKTAGDVLCVAAWGGQMPEPDSTSASSAFGASSNHDAFWKRVSAVSQKVEALRGTRSLHVAVPWIATGSADGVLCVWAVDSAKPVMTTRVGATRGGAPSVEALLPLATQSCIVAGCSLGKLHLIALASGVEFCTLQCPSVDVGAKSTSAGSVSLLVSDAEGRRMLVGHTSGWASIYDTSGISLAEPAFPDPSHAWLAHESALVSARFMPPKGRREEMLLTASAARAQLWTSDCKAVCYFGKTTGAWPKWLELGISVPRTRDAGSPTAKSRAAVSHSFKIQVMEEQTESDVVRLFGRTRQVQDMRPAQPTSGVSQSQSRHGRYVSYAEANPPIESKTLKQFALNIDKINLEFLSAPKKNSSSSQAATDAASRDRDGGSDFARVRWVPYTRVDGRKLVKPVRVDETAVERVQRLLREASDDQALES